MKNTMKFSLITLFAILFLSSCGNLYNTDDYKKNTPEVKVNSNLENKVKTDPIVDKNDKLEKFKLVMDEVHKMKKGAMTKVKYLYPDLKYTKTVKGSDSENVAGMGDEDWLYSNVYDVTVIACNTLNTPAFIFNGKELTKVQLKMVKEEMKQMMDMNGEDNMMMGDHEGSMMMGDNEEEKMGENMSGEKDMMMKYNFKMNDSIGTNILVDNKGMTLYVFKKDTKNVSNCSGECEVKWPVYYNIDLNEDNFSSIKRADGSMQTTYKGFPLYYFFKDTKAGDINGNKVKNVWFVVDKKVLFLNTMIENNEEKKEVMNTISAKGIYSDYSPEKVVNAKGKIVLFFHADWCPTCRATEKDILSKEIPSDLTILKTNFDTETELKQKYGVVAQTTFVQIDNKGNLIKKWVGGRLNDIIEKTK